MPIWHLIKNKLEIHFMHYRTKDEAATKWKRRISRLNLQNLIILFAETENTAADTLKQILASKRFCILLTWKKIYGLINEHYSEVVANSEEHHGLHKLFAPRLIGRLHLTA